MKTADQSYPSNGFAFFNARNEFGELEQNANQCFRVFDTAESFSNVNTMITNRLADAKVIAANLVGNALVVTKLRELQFSLAFVSEWLRDGLYR